MKMKKAYIILITLSLLQTACKKDSGLLYNDVARIQFGPAISVYYSSSQNYADTVKSQTFVYLNNAVKMDTVFFDIYTMGDISDKDRSFALQQENVPGAFNAVAGTHYKALNDPEMLKKYIIPAGQAHALVPIVLLRDESLKTQSATLKIVLSANENFQLGQAQLLWRKVIFTDQLSQPSAWTASASTTYFGKYSAVKHRFMIDVTQQKWDNDFINALIADTQFQHYWMGVVKSALVKYNNEHPGNPLKDEFGDLVVVP